MERQGSPFIGRVVLYYVLFGALWIIATDILVSQFTDVERITVLQTCKGWGFVGLSALLLYLALSREFRGKLQAEQSLRVSEERAEDEKAKLEEQLRQAQRIESIGRLAGGIAHDLNNLLVPILGYTEMALMKLRPHDPLHADLGQIQLAAESAKNLTRQLLAFSRKQVLEMKVLNLNAVLSDFETMLQRLIGENIEVEIRRDPALGNVKADPSQLQQIILNLALNARDAMAEGGRLTIETANALLGKEYVATHPGAQSGRFAMLSVCDTGCGMDRETSSHLFEPFFTTKKLGKGTGLGLATVYGIVKQHGGSIWVESEPGRGTAFTVYLPQVEEAPEATAERVIGRTDKRGAETVLLVEDEEMVRNLVRDILRFHGYEVVEARYPDDALRLAEQHKGAIHLVLTDVILPQMNGRELSRRLAAIHPGIRVLYMSGYTDDVIVSHGVLEAGVHFLQKPFSVESLTEKVREALES